MITGDNIEYIECEESSSPFPNCQVGIEHISVSKGINGGEMTLRFNQRTNKPALLSSNSVHSVLSFSPPVLGAILGEWDEEDSRLLHLYIDYAYYLSILKSYDVDPTSVKVDLRKDIFKKNMKICPHNSTLASNTIVGSKAFKTFELGVYDVHIVDLETMKIVKNVAYKMFQIMPCDDVLFLPSFQGYSITPHFNPSLIHSIIQGNAMNNTLLPSILYRVKGIVATGPLVTSQTIPYSISESLRTHEWGLSFWVLSLDRPNGDFRTLFFKGNSHTNERTPSAWLNQHNNKIIFRLSTMNSNDEGFQTNAEVVIGEWTHIAFTFQKVSESNSSAHTVCIYMNGQLEMAYKFHEPIKYNNDTFMLFKDPSHAGPVGFFKDLIVWDHALTAEHIMSLYSSTLVTAASNDQQSMEAVQISKGIFSNGIIHSHSFSCRLH